MSTAKVRWLDQPYCGQIGKVLFKSIQQKGDIQIGQEVDVKIGKTKKKKKC